MSNFTTVVVDLSHAITADMPVFPGSGQPKIVVSSSVAEDGFAECRITLQTHHGTHVDAPAHVTHGGAHLGEIGADRFLGDAICIDVAGPAIDMSTLTPYLDIMGEIDFVLFATGWSRYWGTERYYSGYPVLTPEAASSLTRFSLKGIGFDTLSADHADNHDLDIHRLLLERMILVENLTNLEKLPKSRFHFSCLPLKIAYADGSPVRAVAHWQQQAGI